MRNTIVCSDARSFVKSLPDNSVDCFISSPPYWGLRDYGVNGQMGLEPTLQDFLQGMVELYREIRRALAPHGTVWVQMGDSYATSPNGRSAQDTKALSGDDRTFRDKPFSTVGNGLKPKDIVGQPWRLAFALQDDGWYLRQDIIWAKPNPMPESAKDRCTKAHEYIFLLTKSGDKTLFTHPYRHGATSRPAPDYRYLDRLTGEELDAPPDGWETELLPDSKKKRYYRFNLWRGHDYYFDWYAIREPASSNDTREPAGSDGTLGSPNSRKRSGNRNSFRSGNYLNNNSFDNDNTVDAPTRCNDGLSHLYRNRRSVWTVPIGQAKFAHFATFPDKLIEPMIKAGCPKDVCAACGAPHVRRVVATGSQIGEGIIDDERALIEGKSNARRMPDDHRYIDLGFLPTCDCNAGTRPGLVVDVFMGSGTVARVARRLERDWAGCDLNEEYTNKANTLLNQTDPLQDREIKPGYVQPSLFEGL